MFKPSSKNIFTDHFKMVLLLWIIFVIHVFVCHGFLSFHCSLVVSCLERADLFARLYLKFSCVLSLFPCPLLVWCLIVSILIFAVLLTLKTQNNDYIFQRTSFNKRNKLKVDGVNPIIKQFLCEPYRFLHMP